LLQKMKKTDQKHKEEQVVKGCTLGGGIAPQQG
jgi:hypothetical protein